MKQYDLYRRKQKNSSRKIQVCPLRTGCAVSKWQYYQGKKGSVPHHFTLSAVKMLEYMKILLSTVSQRFSCYNIQEYIKSTSRCLSLSEETISFFVSVRLMWCELASPCDMEGLPAAMFVAGHTGSSGRFTLSALVLTDITCLHTHTTTHKNTHS